MNENIIESLLGICIAMSKGTGLTPFEVLKIGKSAYYRYKTYKIPKRAEGEFRTIAHPAKEVKILQRWIIENILSDLPVHKCASGYVKGASIKKNALIHANNTYMLKLDFTGFFPSITSNDFIQHFKKYKPDYLSFETISFVSKILFWKETKESGLSLSIGAPSSPLISNTIMYDFDNAVDDYCKKNSMRYSRYADDICISSCNKNTYEAYCHVKQILSNIAYPRLNLNESKTLFISKATKRKITGIVINNRNQISLGRDRKRLISAMVHHSLIHKLSDEDINKLEGLLSFAKDVEPQFYDKLVAKYGERDIIHLFKSQK